MEISTATNATNIAAVASNTKSPDADDFETPVRIHSSNTKPLTFTNGVLKRHQPLLHHHHHGGTGTTTNIPIVVVYKECLKNHAASLGGHALDGCGEFMPSPTATPTDPTSLKCAACGCHRNFHRREPDDPIPLPTTTTTTATTTQVIEYQPHHRHHPPPPPPRGHSPSPPSPPPISSSYYPSSAPHMLLALSAGLQGAPPPDNPHSMGLFGTPTMAAANTNSGTATNHNGRKRFRTRFSQGQKERMYEFAERVGWKMQKKDEETVSEFCNEIGVDRSVLKVWMHNNKNSLGKKSSPPIPSSQADHHHLHHHHLNGSSRNGTTFDQNDTTTTNNNNDEDEDDDENNIQHHHNGGTNGSSSSS